MVVAKASFQRLRNRTKTQGSYRYLNNRLLRYGYCKGVLQTVALKSDRVDDSKRTWSPKGEPKFLDSSLMNCRVSWEVSLYS